MPMEDMGHVQLNETNAYPGSLENELEIVASGILDTVRRLDSRRNSETEQVKMLLYETASKHTIKPFYFRLFNGLMLYL